MAKRLLLTLLALLAGLAAQLTPAQARSSAGVDMEIGASACIVVIARPAMCAAALPVWRKWVRQAAVKPSQPMREVAPFRAAPVLPGIDRARE